MLKGGAVCLLFLRNNDEKIGLKIGELYTSIHHQQHIVFMRISKKTISVLEVAFSILIVVTF